MISNNQYWMGKSIISKRLSILLFKIENTYKLILMLPESLQMKAVHSIIYQIMSPGGRQNPSKYCKDSVSLRKYLYCIVLQKCANPYVTSSLHPLYHCGVPWCICLVWWQLRALFYWPRVQLSSNSSHSTGMLSDSKVITYIDQTQRYQIPPPPLFHVYCSKWKILRSVLSCATRG